MRRWCVAVVAGLICVAWGGEAVSEEVGITPLYAHGTPFSQQGQVAQTLVDILVDGTGVAVQNAFFGLGPTIPNPWESCGLFTDTDTDIPPDASDDLPIVDGFLLATGLAAAADGPNNSTWNTTTLDAEYEPGLWCNGYDPLEDILAAECDVGFDLDTWDATRLAFEFTVPTTARLGLDYFFASEEYPEYEESGYDDIFAFFVDGVAPEDNIARVPGSFDRVSVLSINGWDNPGHFLVYNSNEYDLQYDGLTKRLTAVSPLLAADETHTLEIVIADTHDGQWDAAVFLARGGLRFIEEVTSADDGDWDQGDTWTSEEFPNKGYSAIVHGHRVAVTNSDPSDFGCSLDIQAGGQVVVEPTARLIVQQELWVTDGTLVVQGPRTAEEPPPVSIGGVLDVAAAGEVQIELGAEPLEDTYLSVYRETILQSGSTLNLMPNALAPFAPGTYTLIQTGSFASSPSDRFDSVDGLGGYVSEDVPSGRDSDGLTYTGTTLTVTVDCNLHPGDGNLDTVTDVRDFNIWNANKFTAPTNWKTADFDGDRITDVRDFNVWNAHKFTSADCDPQKGAGGGSKGDPPSSSIEVTYDPVSGEMTLEVDGDAITSVIIEGPEAKRIDRWRNDRLEDDNLWSQDYSTGAEQWWAGLDQSAREDEFELATLREGTFHIATYPTKLSEREFRLVEYGTIYGEIGYTKVQFSAPDPKAVPERSSLVLLLLAAGSMAMASRLKRRRTGTPANGRV